MIAIRIRWSIGLGGIFFFMILSVFQPRNMLYVSFYLYFTLCPFIKFYSSFSYRPCNLKLNLIYICGFFTTFDNVIFLFILIIKMELLALKSILLNMYSNTLRNCFIILNMFLWSLYFLANHQIRILVIYFVSDYRNSCC